VGVKRREKKGRKKMSVCEKETKKAGVVREVVKKKGERKRKKK
jgi:hypothetical protein